MTPANSILDNALTADSNALDRDLIRRLFPALAPVGDDAVLALRPYLNRIPQKWFDLSSQSAMYRWLVDRDATDRAALQDYLRQGRTELDRAFLFLREINAASWHDHMHNPADVFELVRVIDRTFHPAYLRLVEGVLIPLVRVVAHFSRIDRGVGTDGLDAWPVVEEIRRGNNGTLVAPYRHVMRNAIAHGRITYLQDQIQYRDKRNRTETLTNQSVIWTTDDLVDVCNGIAAAVKVFLILNPGSCVGA